MTFSEMIGKYEPMEGLFAYFPRKFIAR